MKMYKLIRKPSSTIELTNLKVIVGYSFLVGLLIVRNI